MPCMWSITQRIRSPYMTNDKNMFPKENLAELGEGQLAKVPKKLLYENQPKSTNYQGIPQTHFTQQSGAYDRNVIRDGAFFPDSAFITEQAFPEKKRGRAAAFYPGDDNLSMDNTQHPVSNRTMAPVGRASTEMALISNMLAAYSFITVKEMDIKELMQHGCDTKTSVRLQDWFYDPDEEYAKRISLPPIKYIMSTHPNCDLNWKPTARWLPSPRYSDAPFPHIKDCKFPERIKLLRSYPRSKSGIHPEWTFYPTLGFPFTYHDGKRCTFQGIHFSNRASEDRQILPACLGRKKKVIDPRNGIPEANPGDKPFHTPEYSSNFHKFGSTRPLVNFKSSYKVKADTFIPLLKMPQTPCVSCVLSLPQPVQTKRESYHRVIQADSRLGEGSVRYCLQKGMVLRALMPTICTHSPTGKVSVMCVCYESVMSLPRPAQNFIDWFYDPDEDCDLNWKPTARWLPSPRYSDAPFPHIKDCKFPERIKLLRSYPRSKSGIHPEWTFYPTLGFPFTYHDGKRCTFQGIHFSNRASEDRQILPACLGRKKKVIDPRNGIPEANPGDKPFHTPEYSSNFHKFGSTRPLVNFKSSYKVKADTFIPLLKMPQTPCVPYRIKAQHQIKKEEKREVEELNDWKPSTRSFHFDIPSTVQKT
ncbi:Hypothetical predicted protein [Pelobates cultripes]|uniref:Uncharacterized protein n=1 Tax=Pelobates cultripes TaxID=61616 RepID=A0AAD1R9H9_PELCU|nr:Hypothetical predicted protein [Pelobates cultripes]